MVGQRCKVQQRPDGRYIIVVPESGDLLDDAQGWGFRSKRKAERAMWYKFKGGRALIEKEQEEAATFWAQNRAFAERVETYYEEWGKEIAIGEVDMEEEVAGLASSMGVAGFKPEFLEHL